MRKALKDLFNAQHLGVLATQGGGQPYSSLVAFAATDDLKYLVFATTRATRKYANLSSESRVAMLIDNRTNQDSDFHNAMAVTAMGTAEEVKDSEKDQLVKRYLAKHPYLEGFVTAPTCALLKVRVDKYYLVSRFQNVMELHLKP
ncbi:MAG: pyridoxamine 5'-phosphate oxidase family protein [Proteobacteria bacterium]|nr:pyridoxamine 5'-phosphate oxidase family protein [Pseudomonadota bacterium]NIS72454.1 pyridoxamine 5'-phosphate oxidase family protein [Pseudomonadota bacterium]